MKLTAGLIPLLSGALLFTAVRVGAMSGTSQVAWPDKPVTAVADWPAGVLDLVNDPLRTEGWNPWFSEWPNDVNHYGFEIRRPGDVNLLLKKLAAIKAAKVQVRLNPGSEASGLGFTTVLKKGNGIAVTFAIGSQRTINEWYQRLPEESPGVRTFGVHRYTNAPPACPPTLTLYLGSDLIRLQTLEIPPPVEISADDISDNYRKEHADDPILKAIDDFVSKHGTKPHQPAKQPNRE